MKNQTFKYIHSFDNFDTVETIALSPDDRIVVSGGWDKSLKLWELKSGQLLRKLDGHSGTISCVTFSRDGKTLVSSSWDKTIKIWNFDTEQIERSWIIEEHAEALIASSLVVSLDGKVLYTGTNGGSSFYWDIHTGQELGSLGGDSCGSSHFSLSADGQTLAGTYIGILIVRSLPDMKRRFRIRTGHSSDSLAISPDGETIFIGDYKGNVHLWSARQGQELSILSGHSGIVETLGISPDGKLLASGDERGNIKIWDLDARGELCHLEAHSEDIFNLIFTSDSRTLISSSIDRSIKVWERQ